MRSVQDTYFKLHSSLSDNKYHLNFGVGIVDQTIFQGVDYVTNGNTNGPGTPIIVQTMAKLKEQKILQISSGPYNEFHSSTINH